MQQDGLEAQSDLDPLLGNTARGLSEQLRAIPLVGVRKERIELRVHLRASERLSAEPRQGAEQAVGHAGVHGADDLAGLQHDETASETCTTVPMAIRLSMLLYAT